MRNRFTHPKIDIPGNDAVIHVLASSRGLGIRSIAERLKISPSTAHRRAQQLVEGQWVIEVPQPSLPALMLNPDRAGIEAYLQWMGIEYGTQASTFWQHVKQLRSPYPDYGTAYPRTHRTEDPEWKIDEDINATLHEAPSPGLEKHYRAFTYQYREITRWAPRKETATRRLYDLAGNERFRDFVHLLIHLGEKTPRTATLSNTTDPRPHLVQLALICQIAKYHHVQYAQGIFEAAIISQARTKNLEKLSTAISEKYFPIRGRELWLSHREEFTTAERARQLTMQLDAGGTRSYYCYGGSPGRHDVGHGGDALLAYEMMQQANKLAKLRDEIFTLPQIAELRDHPKVQDLLVKYDSATELNRPELASETVKTTYLPHTINDDPTTELMIEDQHLIPGDLILQIGEHTPDSPMRVTETTPDTVTIQDERIGVPVSRRGFLDGTKLIIRRPTHLLE